MSPPVLGIVKVLPNRLVPMAMAAAAAVAMQAILTSIPSAHVCRDGRALPSWSWGGGGQAGRSIGDELELSSTSSGFETFTLITSVKLVVYLLMIIF